MDHWITAPPLEVDLRLTAGHTLAAIREQETVPELARRHGLHANQIYKWKKQLLEQAAAVFDAGGEAVGTDREDDLLKKIGELTVERDFLSRGLERRR